MNKSDLSGGWTVIVLDVVIYAEYEFHVPITHFRDIAIAV